MLRSPVLALALAPSLPSLPPFPVGACCASTDLAPTFRRAAPRQLPRALSRNRFMPHGISSPLPFSQPQKFSMEIQLSGIWCGSSVPVSRSFSYHSATSFAFPKSMNVSRRISAPPGDRRAIASPLLARSHSRRVLWLAIAPTRFLEVSVIASRLTPPVVLASCAPSGPHPTSRIEIAPSFAPRLSAPSEHTARTPNSRSIDRFGEISWREKGTLR